MASSGPEVPSMELLRKWRDGKARRELTDFLSGLGVNHVGLSDVSENDFAKVSISPDLACEASNADRSITRSKILSRAAKASGVKGRRSQNDSDSHSLANDVRHALAFIAAEGLRLRRDGDAAAQAAGAAGQGCSCQEELRRDEDQQVEVDGRQ